MQFPVLLRTLGTPGAHRNSPPLVPEGDGQDPAGGQAPEPRIGRTGGERWEGSGRGLGRKSGNRKLGGSSFAPRARQLAARQAPSSLTKDKFSSQTCDRVSIWRPKQCNLFEQISRIPLSPHSRPIHKRPVRWFLVPFHAEPSHMCYNTVCSSKNAIQCLLFGPLKDILDCFL